MLSRIAGVAAVGLTVLLFPAAALAQCLEFGVKQYCSPQIPTAWSVGLCDEAAAFVARQVAWCTVSGGTWTGSNCVGASEHTEGNMSTRSVEFANIVRNSSCMLAGDTGWHATYTTNFCSGGVEVQSQGYLVGTSRRISVTCESGFGETISAFKTRSLECPTGMQTVSLPFFGVMCTKPIECPRCEREGNPITPATGVKRQSETDYRHALGLEIVRHYHSFRFYDARTEVQNAHGESRLGTVWRTSYDKRLMPLQPATQLNSLVRHALAHADGDIQYFDQAGNEVLNYSGGSGSLTVVAGTGFFYKDLDKTEFYGTDGRLRTVTSSSGHALTLTYSDGTTGPNGGFLLDAAGNPTTLVLPANLLIRVADPYGNVLAFGYDTGERIVVATAPGGAQYKYSYGGPDNNRHNLQRVDYPDGRFREYRYNEPTNTGGVNLPHALTSVIDENGVLFATYKYDASGRAISTEHAGGVNKHQLTFNPDGSTSVTDPLNTVRTRGFASVDGVMRPSSSSAPKGSSGVKAETHATDGNVTSRTDFNDVKTCYAYILPRKLESARVEGLPVAAVCNDVLAAGAALPAGSRKILTDWHPRWRLPARMSEPGRRTTYTYNGDPGASCAPPEAVIAEGGPSPTPTAVLCAKTVQATTDLTDGAQGFAAPATGAPRAWTYTYNATGQMLTMDGPRIDASDITAYTYNLGNVATITNAAGHVTQITAYNAHGQPLTMNDPNGLITTMAYDARQRLTSRTVGGETTTYDYDGLSQLTKVTLPDGSFLSYTYDAAHRLTGMEDNLGNRIAYTLDAMGNRTLEEVRDPANALAQTRSRVFSNLNRLFQEFGAQSQTTEYTYDNQGNVATVKDPLNKITANQYDALNRLKQVTDPALGVTQYAYNGLDALVQVSDPRSLVTGYTVDGLGNLTLQASPDTGNTVSTHDAAGNLLTQTDAKSQLTTYAYDALNRVTLITFHDGSKQAYAYDQGTNGVGRLSSITETDPSNAVTSVIAYAYDLHGRVASEMRTVAGAPHVLAYAYDGFGRLSGVTYPSGRTVSNGFDALGRVSQVSTTKDSQTQIVVQNVQYHPFGGVKGFTLGNGQVYGRAIDLDGRIGSYTLGAQSFTIAYDAASRITGIGTDTYGYDNLDRLTSAVLASSSFGYSYDAVGNRLTKTAGAATDTLAYSTTSNRLSSLTPASGPVRNFSFDLNGSTAADGLNTYAYDTRGRMTQATSTLGATSYQVNALGQRIRKSNSLGDTLFHYDTRGRLIAETSSAGILKRELIYLGDIPVGVVQ